MSGTSGIEGRIDGVGSLLAKLGEMGRLAQDAVAMELKNAVILVHNDAVKSIQEHGSLDHVETRYNPKREAEVSAPGAPPNSDRGKLAQSIMFEVDEENLEAAVGTNLEYGKFLELGTTEMRGSRPWLYPAYEKNSEEIKKNISSAVFNALKVRGA